MKKAYELMKDNNIDVPYNVMCVTGSKKIYLCNDQVSIHHEADYVNLNQMREALEWLVDQFGGKIKWKKND